MRAPLTQHLFCDFDNPASTVLIGTVIVPLTIGSTACAQGITAKSLVLQLQSLALPAAGAAVNDPVFGTTLRRFTDRTDNGGYATPVYSQLQAFSYDNDYILLNENDDYVIRRMSDRSVIRGLTLEWNNPRWQPAASRTLVHFDFNADTTVRIQETTIDPVATTTVFTFPADYDRVLVNQSFDEVSRDGRWMGGMVTRVSDNAGVLFAVDLNQPALSVAIPIPTLYAGPCDPDPMWGEIEPGAADTSPARGPMASAWSATASGRGMGGRRSRKKSFCSLPTAPCFDSRITARASAATGSSRGARCPRTAPWPSSPLTGPMRSAVMDAQEETASGAAKRG